MAEEADITNEKDNRDGDDSSFDISQVLKWMEDSDDNGQQTRNEDVQDEDSD